MPAVASSQSQAGLRRASCLVPEVVRILRLRYERGERFDIATDARIIQHPHVRRADPPE